MLPASTWLRLAILLIDDGLANGRRLLPQGFVREMSTATPQNPHAGMSVYVAGDYISGRGAANPDRDIGKTLHGEPYLAHDLFPVRRQLQPGDLHCPLGAACRCAPGQPASRRRRMGQRLPYQYPAARAGR